MHYSSASASYKPLNLNLNLPQTKTPSSSNIAARIQSLSQSLSHPTFERNNYAEPLLSPANENYPPPPPLNTGTALRNGMPQCLTPTVSGCNQSSQMLTEEAKEELTKPPSARITSNRKQKKSGRKKKAQNQNYPKQRPASTQPYQKIYTLSEYQPITDRMDHRPYSSLAYENQSSDYSIGGISRIPPITTSRTNRADEAIEAKEQELKDINKLRIDTLEHIIEDKMRIIEDMQQKLRSNSFAYLNSDQHQNWRELQQVSIQNDNLRSQNNQLKFQNQRINEQKQQAVERVEQLVRRNCSLENQKREIEKQLYRKLNEQKQHFEDELRQKTERTQNQFKYYEKELHKFQKIAKNDMAMKEQVLLFRTKLQQAQYQLDRSNSEQQEILNLLNRLKEQNASIKNRMQIMQQHTSQQEIQIQQKNKHIISIQNALQDSKSISLSDSLRLKDQLESCLRQKNLLQQKIIGQHAALNQCQRELSYLKPQNQSLQTRSERLEDEQRQLKSQNNDSKARFQELLADMRNIERRFHNEEQQHVVAALRVKQLEEELSFVRNNLDTKIRECENTKSSIEMFKSREMQRKQQINVVFERDQLKKVNQVLERDIALIRGEMMAVREESRIKQTIVDMAPTKQDKMILEDENSKLKMQINNHILQKNKAIDSKKALQRQFRELQSSYIQYQERSQNSINEPLQFSAKNSTLHQSIRSDKQNLYNPTNQFQLSNAIHQTLASKQKISQLQDHVKELTSQLRKWVSFDSRTRTVAGLKSQLNSVSKSAKNNRKNGFGMISPAKLQYPFGANSPSQIDDSFRPVQESKSTVDSISPLTLKQKIDEISQKPMDNESKLAGKIDAIKLSLQ